MTPSILTSLVLRRVFIRLACEDAGRLACEDAGSHYTLAAIDGEWLKLESRPAQDGRPAKFRYVPFSAVAYIDADDEP